MKSFIKKLVLYLSILLLHVLIGLFLPATPRAKTSHMFAKLKMDDLLKNAESPRLILIGGSNISLSINSQMLKDSLKFNPINTGVSWTIGFVYNLDNTLKYVRPGDVLVASLEYDQFYDGNAYGGQDLARTILDVSPKDIFKLRYQQLLNIIPHFPYYAFTKYKGTEYFFDRNPQEIYDRDATNQYGDNCKHWNLGAREFDAEGPLPEDVDQFAFDLLYRYKVAIEGKGATLFVTFPAYQQTSFQNQYEGIKTIEQELRRKDLTILGNPERYRMPDSLMFDTPYHLIKKGVDLRTGLLIEDLKKVLSDQP